MTATPPPSSDPFRTDHLGASLKGHAVRGGAITMVSQAAKLLLNLGSTMALARLLAPQDFGLVGMVAAVVGFAEVFKDLGLSTATIQRAEINHPQVSTLFWLNIALSLAITLVIAAAAPVIAWFYHDPRLTAIGLVLASLYLLGGAAVQHQALLRRQMRFGVLAIIDLAALGAGIATGVLLAWDGWGYWALVHMQVAMAVVSLVGVWQACSWRPGRPRRGSGVRSLVAFGANLTAFDFLNYLARNLDNVLIGWRWGAANLGFYSKAYQLLLMPMQQINAPIRAVAIPTLSRLQHDPQQFRSYYLKALTLITLISLPLVLLFLLLAEEIVLVLLGPQWRETAILFRLLGIAALVQPVLNTAGWFYVARGEARRMLRWGLISVPLFVASFLIGLPFGPSGVAGCYAVMTLLLTIPCLWYATHGSAVQVRDVMRVAGRHGLAAIVAVAPCVPVKFWLGDGMPPLALIGICVVIAAAVYAGYIFGVLRMKDECRSLLQHFRKPETAPPPAP